MGFGIPVDELELLSIGEGAWHALRLPGSKTSCDRLATQLVCQLTARSRRKPEPITISSTRRITLINVCRA